MVGMGSRPSGCAIKLVFLVPFILQCDSNVLRYPFKHRSLLEDEGREGYPGQVGARAQLGDNM